MKVLSLTRHGRLGASSRLRSLQFISSLKEVGIEPKVQSFFSDRMLAARYENKRYSLGAIAGAYVGRVVQLLSRRQYDLIWIEKEALPWIPALLEKTLLRGVPYILDYDDAIFHNYDLHRSVLVRRLLGRRIDSLMAGARLVIAGNDYLAVRARNAGASWVEFVPTVIDLERYVIKPVAPKADVPRVVWIGSPTTVKYLAALKSPLARLARRTQFKLQVIGGTLEIPGVDVECLPWSEVSEVEAISRCDVGIMPLSDSPWERGKCGYKLIQYMACSLPVVASPVGVNTQIVLEGVNGYLANSDDEWVGKLEQLLRNPSLRQSMGRAGRQRIEMEYCVQQVGPRLARLLLKAGS